MTHTTNTQATNTQRPETRRTKRAAQAAGVAVAAIASVTGLAAISGSAGADRPPTVSEHPAPAVATSTVSADAAERAALQEASELVESCRATTVAPDSLERCIGHGRG